MTDLHFNKKGNAIVDTISIVVILIVFGIITFYGWTTSQELIPMMRPELNSSVEAQASLTMLDTRYAPVMDSLFVFVFVGLWIAALISAAFLKTHPIFFVVSILLIVFILFAGMELGNFYEELSGDSSMTGVSAAFPMSNWLLSHLAIIIIVMGSSIMIAMFGKTRVEF